MSRLVILMLFFCLLTSHVSRTKAAGPCNFRGISQCWNDILSKYCVNGVCQDDPDYCDDREFLSECFRVNCEMINTAGLPWESMFAGICSKPVKDDSEDA